MAAHPAASAGKGTGASVGRGLAALGLGLLSAAGWRRRHARAGAGRVVVRGRNYETNIKHKKGPAEAKKARTVSKYLRRIIVAVKEKGADEAINTQLARIIKSALKENVPRSTIDGRIKKYLDGGEAVTEMVLSGYGAGSSAVMVECTTDNTNRTRVEVKEAFKEGGGQVGAQGSVDHIFQKQGVLRFRDVDEETVMEASMETDVEDCVAMEDGTVEVITLPENLHKAVESFDEQDLEPFTFDHEFSPTIEADLNEEHTYELRRLLYYLEEIDDVQDVHHNGKLVEGVELKFNNYGQPLPYHRAVKAK